MRTTTACCSVLAALALLAGSRASLAAMPAFFPSAPPPRPASACPALFGDAEARELNRARRAALIHWLAADAGTITVAHASDRWDEPRRLRLAGLRVRAVDGGQATVAVRAALAARCGCEPGTYSIGRDMSIGGAAVIGVLPGGLLVERRGRLRFVPRAGTRTPDWQMIWGSPYEVVGRPTPARSRSRYAHIIF